MAAGSLAVPVLACTCSVGFVQDPATGACIDFDECAPSAAGVDACPIDPLDSLTTNFTLCMPKIGVAVPTCADPATDPHKLCVNNPCGEHGKCELGRLTITLRKSYR